jgi:translation initiation factor 5B
VITIVYRQPIITVMGHIDSGKTTFLDRIKGTSIVDKEAGKITQHIGATEVTIETINKFSGHLVKKYNFELMIPGLLFIDTPGHNAFDNLRERGGSLADLVVLVMDINKGLQVQDIQTINILKMYKVPFIVVANKIDLVSGFNRDDKDILVCLNNQSKNVSEKLEELLYRIVGQLYDKGFAAERFDRVSDFTKQIAIIPANVSNDLGLPESILFLSVLSQKFLGKKLTIEDNDYMQGAVLEVGELKGIGSTADVIVYQGQLKVKDEICFPTRSGLKCSKIKALLKPNFMTAVDKKCAYEKIESVSAAAGIKIVAPEIADCLPGAVIVSAEDKVAIENLKNKAYACLVKGSTGAFVKADTLGSLEALHKLLDKECVAIASSDIGDFTNRDLLELKILHEKNKEQGVLFLFNVKINQEFLDEIEKLKIPIFKNNIIYKLIEDYQEWLSKLKKQEKDKLLKEIIYPCSFKVLPNFIFRSCKPAVVGVRILEGRLVVGSNLELNGNKIGEVEGIQSEGKAIDVATEESEVAVSIRDATYLKDFKEGDILKVSLTLENISNLEKLEGDLSSREQELIIQAKNEIYKKQNQ